MDSLLYLKIYLAFNQYKYLRVIYNWLYFDLIYFYDYVYANETQQIAGCNYITLLFFLYLIIILKNMLLIFFK